MRFRTWYLIALACVALATTGCFSPSIEASSGKGESGADDQAKCLTPEDAERLADHVLQLVNLERAAEGLPPLVPSLTLEEVAEAYACRMIDGGFFDHRDPATGHGPSERAWAAKYEFFAIGENLAAGQETAAEVMEVWMNSPSHRANILDPTWEDIGIGVRAGGPYSIYWVQEFGLPVPE